MWFHGERPVKIKFSLILAIYSSMASGSNLPSFDGEILEIEYHWKRYFVLTLTLHPFGNISIFC